MKEQTVKGTLWGNKNYTIASILNLFSFLFLRLLAS